MSTLCTMPGRHGDIIWCLPAVRAIAEQEGTPVDLQISHKYGSLAPLIEQQSYIRNCINDPFWPVQETAPMTPQVPPIISKDYDRVIHLGYDGWPAAPLPYDIANRAGVAIDLRRPWITYLPFEYPSDYIIGFTDEWYELKLGITAIVAQALNPLPGNYIVVCPQESRWATECRLGNLIYQTDWTAAARFLAGAKIFFGCCSALHVLAVALGIPCVIMEPAEARHHPIFWPLGTTGPEVTLVLGGDGKPTHDARHCAEALSARLWLAEKEGR